jgi:hypothetical protein
MQRIFAFLAVFFMACTSDNGASEKNSLSSIDSNTANNSPSVHTDHIVIQGFTQLPSIIHSCSAVFVNDTTSKGSQEYFFVSNLKGIAFIKLNNRLMELKLIKQTNFDKYTVNELYMNDEIEVDLKIRQLEEGTENPWNYEGVLIVKRGNEREAINISGKLGC